MSSQTEVFLSFRGPDTRRHFADFLYTRLTDAGIRVFRDEEELVRGKEIIPQLIREINQSKISIPVISKEYASSKSCLVESEQMVECMDKKNHVIIPIFYYVDPSDVRHCNGSFERAFGEHKKFGVDDSCIDSWKSALHRIGKLKGHHLHEKSEVYHGEVIKQIVREVQHMLKTKDLIVTKQLVRVDHHVQEIMAKLKVEYHNGQAVKIGDTCGKVLIYGIPGVGKTVLAKCVYNQLHHQYDAYSFLEKIQEEIRDHGILSVQNRLISHLHKGNAQKFDCSDNALTYIQDRFAAAKVLLLLDDIKDNNELSKLVGELDWFGLGSTVIVTSQRDDVLKKLKGAESFGLRMMQQDEALQLFCRHAFEKDSPPEEFEELSTNIVAATDGLPLALESVGQSLFQVKKRKAWTETLTGLKEAPHESVQAAFSKGYNTLKRKEKEMFLDIACFFNGKDKRIPYYMWLEREYSPSISILPLRARSLVKIGENKELWMHETLKNFGRQIVKSENNNEPCKRPRLCNPKDALHVLTGGKGTVYIEALELEFPDRYAWNFDGLQNPRFLKLDRADIRGNFGDCSSSLRWLDWRGWPEIFDDHVNLTWQSLVILDLSWSLVQEDWSGWEHLGEARRLKVLKLTGCVKLSATPKFPASMELERLILEGCSSLAVIDPSFCNLEKLASLNMKGCSRLHELPDLGPMRGLKELVIDGTSISRINFQQGCMRKLKTLSARDCKCLNEISDSIRYLESLTYLSLDGSEIYTLPESIRSLKKLKTLSLMNRWRLSNGSTVQQMGLPAVQKIHGFPQMLPMDWKRSRSTALEVAPHKRVQAALKTRYTNLDKNERQIFPDQHQHQHHLYTNLDKNERQIFPDKKLKMDNSHVTGHSSSVSRQPPDEVFLSFGGPEMRRGFVDFLYTLLSDTGIRFFRDAEELEKENYQQLNQVIEQCKISIPIISKEYASSKNCLTELEQMVKGMDNKNRIIIPIFYYVDPSDVRDCNGPFATSLVEHKERGISGNVIDSWKSALRRIGELEGHHLHEKSEVSHGEVVKQIVHKVQQKLKKQDLIVTKQLVVVDSHAQGIMAKLKVDYCNGQAVQIRDTRENVLGIYGIPGVGKTVLAKCVYNRLYHLFDACSFLGEIQGEIKHHGIVSVQNKLISHLDKGNAKQFDSSEEALFHIRNNFCTRKVLVLLDDVYDHEQLSELVGELDWLGPGSRVILTSQTQDVLRNIDSAEGFVLEPMKQDEALKLFCRHAFGTDYPREELEKLSTDIVAATAGLPLTLEEIGSSLYLVKSKKAWRETLTALLSCCS